MIRRVVLRGWKAFDHLEFEPDPGVTFVVARNGVGKSSLLQGLAWSVFGDRSGVDPAKMRRAGHDQTATTVELDLPDGRILTIEREVGGDTVSHIGDYPVEDLDEALRSIVGANLDFAARAVTLTHQTLIGHAESFKHLEDHLAEVFGVAGLRGAADAMAAEHARIKSANTKLRSASKAGAADVAELQTRAEALRAEIVELTGQRAALEPELAAAEDQRRSIEQHTRDIEAHRQWVQAYEDLRARVTDDLGTVSDDLGRVLGEAVQRVSQSIASVTMEIGASEARVTLAKDALVSLETPGALCPTCQRPLSEHERGNARATHLESVSVGQAATTRANDELERLRAEAALRQHLLAEHERLGPEPDVQVGGEVDLVAAEEALARIRSRASELDRAVGEREGVLNEIERTMAARAASAAVEAERYRAIRREAVAQLAADMMRRTVDALMAEFVIPTADEVSSRWKQVFGDRGTLRLSPKGVITMEHDGHVIEFDCFSPGEQVVSMLALRFLTVAASTTSPFMLLDEPLECLDPPNRRLIASVLTGTERPVKQMIVTTYEEALVRRIHATVPDTALHMIG